MAPGSSSKTETGLGLGLSLPPTDWSGTSPDSALEVGWEATQRAFESFSPVSTAL